MLEVPITERLEEITQLVGAKRGYSTRHEATALRVYTCSGDSRTTAI